MTFGTQCTIKPAQTFMSMRDAFRDFVESVESVIRTPREPKETVSAIEPILRRLVSERDWLTEQYRRPIPTKPYAQYLLHRPSDLAFSVVSFVWNPGQGSPIHDHCTWGVIGQYEGEEEETRFRIVDNRLERIGIVVARPGDVSHVYPPSRDIHQISNRSSSPTISIHVYGGDIGSQRRHSYDLSTAAMHDFISGYDQL
jgi:predicted metal-dependent enzyme (double-stranded beta helix superfamily)